MKFSICILKMAIIYELSNTRFFFIRSPYGLALEEGQGRSVLCNPHFGQLLYNLLENYKNVDEKGFEEANNLTYKDETTGRIEKFNIRLKVDHPYALAKWGGAKTELKKDRYGKFYGVTVLSNKFNMSDDHMAHESGHNITNASNPYFWNKNTVNDLNCQENPTHYQAKKAIDMQRQYNEQIIKQRGGVR